MNKKIYESPWSVRLVLSKDFATQNKSEVSQLKEILNQLGIAVNLDEDTQVVTINRTIECEQILKRGAGSKPKLINTFLTVKEIEEKIAQTNAMTVAKELGVSRSTLFRRLKVAKEINAKYL